MNHKLAQSSENNFNQNEYFISEFDRLSSYIAYLERKIDEIIQWRPLVDHAIADINNKIET